MNNDEWQTFCEKVNEYENSPDASAPNVVAINALCAAGEEDANERENVQSSVKALLKGKPGNPFRGGRMSVLSPAQNAEVNRRLGEFALVVADAFDGDVFFCEVILPHGRSKKDAYENGADFAESIVAKAVENAKSMAKEGTLNSLLGL